ncbi:MAG TPA: cob(I)yrinic acid a,c-diamide adenosyltransferase [Phycisphaerae bacterium]|nr:cob(I)yrinic acid a,c-diamide adenosyltransferase [Phycisphaerae bacterium]
MARLYTRKGDDGGTVLFDGTRVRKDDIRVEAYGDIDELNAHLGDAVLVIPRGSDPSAAALRDRIIRIQHELFSIGAELATPAESPRHDKLVSVAADQISRLESWIDEAAAATPPLNSFILPGGDPLACRLHICRTVCRRAERRAVALASRVSLNSRVLAYLNRLGDLLFAWARLANHLAGIADQPWIKPESGHPAP